MYIQPWFKSKQMFPILNSVADINELKLLQVDFTVFQEFHSKNNFEVVNAY